MLIYIKTLTGEKKNFNFDDDHTVLNMKETLMEQTGIGADQIKLIFGGKSLNDENTLGSYSIKPGDTIHMVASFRGGN